MMTLVSPDGRYVVFSSSALSLLNMTRRFDEMMLVSTSFEAKVQYQNPARALRRSWFSHMVQHLRLRKRTGCFEACTKCS